MRRSENDMTAPRTLLENRNYVRLFTAQLTSLIGSGVTSIALAAFAYQLAGRDATVIVGIALMLRILAFVSFSPAAGVLADRVNRKRLLVAADLVRVLLMGTFPFITTVWQIYLLIFLLNAVTAFFTPTFEASIPEIVGPTLYTRALAWSRVALDVESAGGPLLAGLLIALVGVRWAFWFNALTYLASALLVSRSVVPRAAPASAPFPWSDLWTQVTHGTRVLLREPALRQALVLHFAEAAAGACAIVATVAYVHVVLGRGDTAFAVSMAAVGVGSSLAAVVASRRAERATEDAIAQATADATERVEPAGAAARHAHLRYHGWASRSMLLGGVLLASALLPGVFRPGLLLLLVLWALNGAGQALIAVPSVGLLAAHTLREERGRAYAAHFALTHLFWLVTYPAVGYLARYAGTPRTFTWAGVAVVALILFAVLVGRGPHREHRLVE
jgi:MFS transporter, NRE family, putaive nickel resistance protein